MYLISAYFDQNTTKHLTRLINTVAQKSGNTYMTDNNVPPHMTISSFEMRDPYNLIEDFNKLKNIGAGDINIISVGAFLPYVLYASPVLNNYLQTLAENTYKILTSRDDIAINKCYKPYQWFPHITLGKKLSKEEMQTAFEAMQIHFSPIAGKIVRLGLSETNPHRDIAGVELINKADKST